MRTAAAIVLAALAIGSAPAAHAAPFNCPPTALGCPTQHVNGFDCRYDAPRICGVGNPHNFAPGWYGDDSCWPGAIYCADPQRRAWN
jgi:hypothetical protein